MFKKTVTFEDLDDNTVQETLYFNFNKLEIIEMMEVDKLEEKLTRLGIDAKTKELTDPENTKEAYYIFKDLILKAHGKKAANNRGFDKVDPVDGHPYRRDLEASPALGEIIIEFIQNPGMGAEFVEKCLPQKLMQEAKAQQVAQNPKPEEITEMVELAAERQNDPATRIEPAENRTEAKFEDYTEAELLSMSQEDFKNLIPREPKDMTTEQLRIAFQRRNQE